MTRRASQALALLAALLAGAAAHADPGSGYPGGHMWGGGGWLGWFAGPVMMVLMVGAVVAVVVLVVRWLGGAGQGQSAAHPPAPSDKTPVQILEERYARGEIDEQEFERRRRVLQDRSA